MFEKESEEYAGNREVCDLLDAISEDLQNYDYGTVAHYNIDPLVEECFKDGAEFGYNKAKEWQYVKEECKYPENGESVLVTVLDDDNGKIVTMALFEVENNKRFWDIESRLCSIHSGSEEVCSKIIAWARVLPAGGAEKMIGYKAFDKDLKCRGFQFEVGHTYDTGAKKEDLKLCTNTVFHFCRELYKIEKVSSYNITESRICEVIAVGDIVDDNEKFGTNRIHILRELTQEEKEKFNNCNTGDWNTGNHNTGNHNTGNHNTGDFNTGNWNTGDWNTGFFNTKELPVYLFNKSSEFLRDDLIFPSFLLFDMTVWVSYDTATVKEKEKHKEEIECSGGGLKTIRV